MTVARVMVQLPATTRMGESRTWGPYEPGGADPLTYRLVVNRLGEAVFAYTLSARNQSAGSDNEFLVVLDGSVRYAETTGQSGVLPAGSIEWMRWDGRIARRIEG